MNAPTDSHSRPAIDGMTRAFVVLALGVAFGHFVMEDVVRPLCGPCSDFVDFSPNYCAAVVIREGLGSIYSKDALASAYDRRGVTEGRLFGYTYPPLYAVAMRPLARLSYPAAKLLFWLLNQAMLAGAVVLLWRGLALGRFRSALPLVGLVVFAYAPLAETVRLGQANIIIFALVAAAFVLAEKRRDVAAGACLAVAVCVQLIPLTLVAYYAWRRRWRLAVSSVVCGAVLTGWAAWAAGTGDTERYLREIVPVLAEGNAQASGQSLNSFFLRLFTRDTSSLPDTAQQRALLTKSSEGPNAAARHRWVSPPRWARARRWYQWSALAVVAGTAAMCLSWRAPCSTRERLEVALVIVATSIISANSKTHHLTWLLLPFLVVLVEVLASRGRAWPALLLWAGAYVLITCPLGYDRPAMQQGWRVVFVSTKLYGALVLWALIAWLIPRCRGGAVEQEEGP